MTGAIALALLLAGAGVPAKPPPSEPKRFTWDVPQVLEQVEVPGVVVTQGLPMKLHAVRSRLPLADLMQHFARRFAEANLYVPPPQHLTQVSANPMLTALDPARKVNFTVIFQPNKDGTTTVICAEAHLAERRPTSGPTIAPVLPGATSLVQANVAEHVRTMTYRTTATEPEVARFYRETLAQHGYQEFEALRFKKEDHQLSVAYQRGEEGPPHVVVVRQPYLDDRPPRPDEPAR